MAAFPPPACLSAPVGAREGNVSGTPLRVARWSFPIRDIEPRGSQFNG
jgi:hypothetical protein